MNSARKRFPATPHRTASPSASSLRSVSASKNMVRATTEVEFHSVLRIRPLDEDEQDEALILETVPSGGVANTTDSTNSKRGSVVILRKVISQPEPSTVKRKLRATSKGNHEEVRFSAKDERKFSFDTVLDTETSQKDLYYSTGLPMALDVMEPLLENIDDDETGETLKKRNHVVVSLGVTNSGKTHTTIGDLRNRQIENPGLVPKLMDDLFSQYSLSGDTKENGSTFALKLSMVHVHNEHVYDMLSSFSKTRTRLQTPRATRRAARSTKSSVLSMVESMEGNFAGGGDYMEELRITQDSQTNDFRISPTIQNCTSAAQARSVLTSGWSCAAVSRTGLNNASSRGHTIITIQPVVLGDDHHEPILSGGTITVIDMAGIERTKKSRVSGSTMRESIAINSSISGVLNCLRMIKRNGVPKSQLEDGVSSSRASLVPYRQGKLTMLLQPVFSASNRDDLSSSCDTSSKTIVTLLVSAYPGDSDYAEKKSLFTDIEALRGLSLVNTTDHPRFHRSQRCIEEDSCMKEFASPEQDTSSHMASPPFRSPDATSTTSQVTSSSEKKQHMWMKAKSPLKRISKAVTSSGNQRQKDQEEMEHDLLRTRIQQLESDNMHLVNRNEDLESALSEVKAERHELMERLKRAELLQVERKYDMEREDLEESRRIRQKQQQLLSSPLVEHMQEVAKVSETHAVGQRIAGREPFKLIPPKDRRKQKEEVLQTATKEVNGNDENKRVDLNRQESTSSIKRKQESLAEATEATTSPNKKRKSVSKYEVSKHEAFFLGVLSPQK